MWEHRSTGSESSRGTYFFSSLLRSLEARSSKPGAGLGATDRRLCLVKGVIRIGRTIAEYTNTTLFPPWTVARTQGVTIHTYLPK